MEPAAWKPRATAKATGWDLEAFPGCSAPGERRSPYGEEETKAMSPANGASDGRGSKRCLPSAAAHCRCACRGRQPMELGKSSPWEESERAGRRLGKWHKLCKRAARKRDGALLAIKIKFTARLSPGEGEGRGGASWERDGAGKRGSLAFCSHRRGKAVSFAGLIGLMRFPYSSLRGCQ